VIRDKEGTRLLQIDDSFAVHSLYAPGSWLSEDIWDEFLVLPITVSGRPPASVAILGNAGGTTAREYGHFFPNTLVYGVDIDPKMAEIGRRFFDLHGPRLKLVSEDARPFLRKSGRFDSIFLDAYREPEIPWYLTTREFFELVRRHLVPGGSLIANVAHSAGSDALEQTITRTMRSVFPSVIRDPVTKTNSALVASNLPATAARLQSYLPRLPEELRELGAKIAHRLSPPLAGGAVYTDDRDAIEWLIDRDIIQHDLQGSSASSGNGGGSGTSGGAHGVSGLCGTPCTDEEGDYVDQVALVPQSAVPSVVPIVSMRVRVKNLEKSSLEIGSSELPITDSRQHKVEPTDFARVAQCPHAKTLTLAPGQEGVFHPCYKLADRTDVPTGLLLGGKGGTEIPLR
jgi:predicted O-methyltransferase YrrM